MLFLYYPIQIKPNAWIFILYSDIVIIKIQIIVIIVIAQETQDIRHPVFSQPTPIVFLSFCFPSAFSPHRFEGGRVEGTRDEMYLRENVQHIEIIIYFLLLEDIVKIDEKFVHVW